MQDSRSATCASVQSASRRLLAALVLRLAEDGIELVQLRQGFAPGRPKAASVINVCFKGRQFNKGRCLVPASHFYEFAKAKPPKSKWQFTKAGADWFCLPDCSVRAADAVPASFTLLTTAPGPDVTPIHHRQMLVLERADWLAWLELSRPEAKPAVSRCALLIIPLPCPGHAQRAS